MALLDEAKNPTLLFGIGMALAAPIVVPLVRTITRPLVMAAARGSQVMVDSLTPVVAWAASGIGIVLRAPWAEFQTLVKEVQQERRAARPTTPTPTALSTAPASSHPDAVPLALDTAAPERTAAPAAPASRVMMPRVDRPTPAPTPVSPPVMVRLLAVRARAHPAHPERYGQVEVDVQVRDLAYEKTVRLYGECYQGQKRVQQGQLAELRYITKWGGGEERWGGTVELPDIPTFCLRLAVNYEVNGQTYWDDNGGQSYWLGNACEAHGQPNRLMLETADLLSAATPEAVR